MMNELLIRQLKFARAEFKRVFTGVEAAEAETRLMPNNSLSWIVGHLAWQEQRYWIWLATNKQLYPELNELVAFGKPPSTPNYEEMWDKWRDITQEADRFVDQIKPEDLGRYFTMNDKRWFESIGTLMQRTIFHYWFHTGEVHAIRQQLGHQSLPDFVGRQNLVAFHEDGWLEP